MILNSENKYYRIYYQIIERAKNRILSKEIYTENHHIIPIHCGGGNTKDNIVTLTYKEHFLCHKLLYRIVPQKFKYGALKAVRLMCYATSDKKLKVPFYFFRHLKVKERQNTMPLETRNKIAEATRVQFKDPEKQKRHKDGVNKRWNDPEERTKNGKASAKRFEDVEFREKFSNIMKDYYKVHTHPNKGKKYDHLSVEERKKMFGRQNIRRLTEAEQEKKIQKTHETRKKKATLDFESLIPFVKKRNIYKIFSPDGKIFFSIALRPTCCELGLTYNKAVILARTGVKNKQGWQIIKFKKSELNNFYP